MPIPNFVQYRQQNHIPFDIYFAGDVSCDDYFIQAKANRLQSQLNEKRNILKLIDKGFEGKLFIDSGAFSAHTKGKQVDVDKYIEFVNEIDDHVEIFAQLDTIPGEFGKPKTEEQLKNAPKLSWDNYLYMKDKVKSKHKLLPVYHQGEDIKWLKNMLEFTDEDGYIQYIGISPANDQPVQSKERYIKQCFKVINESSNPNVKTHAFGMTSLQLLEQYPFYSADSTTWHREAMYGLLFTPYGRVSFSTRSKNLNRMKSHYNNLGLNNNQQNKIIDWLKSIGLTLEEVQLEDNKRKLANARYFLWWAQNYKFKGDTLYTQQLF